MSLRSRLFPSGYTPFKYRLTASVLAVFIPVFLIVGGFSLSRAHRDYRDTQLQVEQDIVHSLQIIDEAYRILEATLEQQLGQAMERFLEAYEQAEGNPSDMDLSALQEEFGNELDLYIVDTDGVVTYSTVEHDLGLDLTGTPEAAAFFETLLEQKTFAPQRMSRETKTGKLRKFAYHSAPDGRWVLELAVKTEVIAAYLERLDPVAVADRLVATNAILDQVRVLDMDGWEVSVSDPVAPDEELTAVVHEVIEHRDTRELEHDGGARRYLYVELDDDESYQPAGVARVVELTYNRTQLTAELHSTLTVILLGALVTVLLAIHLANRTSEPILELEQEFTRAAEGDLTAYAQPRRRDELGSAARSFNRMMEQIRLLTYYDPVTGLPNHRVLLRDFERLAPSTQPPAPKAVLLVAANRFRQLNERIGYRDSNRVLHQAARRVEMHHHDTCFEYRGQSDEFILLLSGSTAHDDGPVVADALLRDLDAPYDVDGHQVSVSFSAGLALYPTHGVAIDELLKNAGFARNFARERQGARLQVFDPELLQDVLKTRRIINEVDDALRNRELFLEYQPLVNLETGEVVAAEALIRWRHPTDGIITPDNFIAATENNELIIRIGEWALQQACRDCAAWNEGLTDRPVKVCVNISARQFESPQFLPALRDALAEHGLAPQLLELELTESTVIENMQESVERLQALRAMGLRISIDDFGTGYSSLSYMVRLPIDTLKIDRSFISLLEHNKHAETVVSTIIAMGRSLNLALVAEGIETSKQLAALRNEACTTGQGFYFSRPIARERFMRTLRDDPYRVLVG